VLCGNAARIYGFDLEWLARTRAEVAKHRHLSPARAAPSWSPDDLKRPPAAIDALRAGGGAAPPVRIRLPRSTRSGLGVPRQKEQAS
jgi:hypothetical protein